MQKRNTFNIKHKGEQTGQIVKLNLLEEKALERSK